jgi:ubiquitin C-terminal hydrolase
MGLDGEDRRTQKRTKKKKKKKEIFESFEEEELTRGEVCAVVPIKWLNQCKEYIQSDCSVDDDDDEGDEGRSRNRPSKLDTRELLFDENDEREQDKREQQQQQQQQQQQKNYNDVDDLIYGHLEPRLKENLRENIDYGIVREETLKKLIEWFGCVNENELIYRTCVNEDSNVSSDNNNNNNNESSQAAQSMNFNNNNNNNNNNNTNARRRRSTSSLESGGRRYRGARCEVYKRKVTLFLEEEEEQKKPSVSRGGGVLSNFFSRTATTNKADENVMKRQQMMYVSSDDSIGKIRDYAKEAFGIRKAVKLFDFTGGLKDDKDLCTEDETNESFSINGVNHILVEIADSDDDDNDESKKINKEIEDVFKSYRSNGEEQNETHTASKETQTDGYDEVQFSYDNDDDDGMYMEKTDMQVDDTIVSTIAQSNKNAFGGGGDITMVRAPKRMTLEPTNSLQMSLPSSYSFGLSSPKNEIETDRTKQNSGSRGKAGLQNLGNTCFMNSALQCLSHTSMLTDAFLSNAYVEDINEDNPIGMGGKLAREYAKLIGALWRDGAISVAPRSFKSALANFAPQFSGYNQQDAQELLAFLLDGLHEDLNRVKKKPYVEERDATGRTDADVAKEHWENHLARNDSRIVDAFQGQYKQTLVCPDCENRSVKFDPFMYLTVPLPTTRERELKMTIVFGDHPEMSPMKVVVTVDNDGLVKDLEKKLFELLNSEEFTESTHRWAIVDLWKSKIWKIFEPLAKLREIQNKDIIFAYVLPKMDRDDIYVQVCHRKPMDFIAKSSSWFGTSNYSTRLSSTLTTHNEQDYIGFPFLIPTSASSEDTVEAKEACEKWIEKFSNAHFLEDANKDDDDVSMEEHEQRKFNNEDPQRTEFEEKCDGKDFALRKSLSKIDEWYEPKQTNAQFLKNSNKKDDASKIGSSGFYGGYGFKIGNDSYINNNNFNNNNNNNNSNNGVSGGDSSSPTKPVEDELPNVSTKIIIGAYWKKNHEDAFDKLIQEHESFIKYEKEQQNDSTENSGKKTPLSACMEHFIKEEPLGEDDMWYCGKCEKHVPAKCSMKLWRAPPILILHLKRFQYSRSWRDKIDVKIDYPLENFDISPFLSEDALFNNDNNANDENGHDDASNVPQSTSYDLYAVVNHYGSMGGGHYTAYAKHAEDGSWHSYDDSFCRPIDTDQVQESNAGYVLFYKRKDFDMHRPMSRVDLSLDLADERRQLQRRKENINDSMNHPSSVELTDSDLNFVLGSADDAIDDSVMIVDDS